MKKIKMNNLEEKLNNNIELNKEEVEYLINHYMIDKSIIEQFDNDLEYQVVIEIQHKYYMLYYMYNPIHEIEWFESQIATEVKKVQKLVEVWEYV